MNGNSGTANNMGTTDANWSHVPSQQVFFGASAESVIVKDSQVNPEQMIVQYGQNTDTFTSTNSILTSEFEAANKTAEVNLSDNDIAADSRNKINSSPVLSDTDLNTPRNILSISDDETSNDDFEKTININESIISSSKFQPVVQIEQLNVPNGRIKLSATREKKIYIDPNQCRICLGSDNLIDIFLFDEHRDLRICDMIMKICSTIHIGIRDYLPHFVCESCVKRVSMAFDLRSQCEQTEKILRGQLKRSLKKGPRPAEVLVDCFSNDSGDEDDEKRSDDEFHLSEASETDSDNDVLIRRKRPQRVQCRSRKSTRSTVRTQMYTPKVTNTIIVDTTPGHNKCKECNLEFPTKKDLQIHTQMTHASIYMCNDCKLTISTKLPPDQHKCPAAFSKQSNSNQAPNSPQNCIAEEPTAVKQDPIIGETNAQQSSESSQPIAPTASQRHILSENWQESQQHHNIKQITPTLAPIPYKNSNNLEEQNHANQPLDPQIAPMQSITEHYKKPRFHVDLNVTHSYPTQHMSNIYNSEASFQQQNNFQEVNTNDRIDSRPSNNIATMYPNPATQSIDANQEATTRHFFHQMSNYYNPNTLN